MFRSFSRFFRSTLRGHLILGVALVHAVMMTLFITDLVNRQKAMILEQHIGQAMALSHALATSAAGWIASGDVAGLQELVAAQTRYPELMFAMFTDERGHILAHSDPTRPGFYLQDLPKEVRQTILSRSATLVDVINPVLIGGRHVGWVRIGIGQRIVSKRLSELVDDSVGYAIAAILVGALIAWIMGTRITRRMYALLGTIDAIRQGDHEARTAIQGADEVAVIATEFNAMLDTLSVREQELSRANGQLHEELRLRRQTEEALRESRSFLSGIVNCTSDIICVKDLEGRYLLFNGAAENFVGKKASDVIGRDDTCLFPHAEAKFIMDGDRAVIGGGAVQTYEEHLTDRNGRAMVLLSTKGPLVNENGNTIGLFVIARDITERIRADEEKRAFDRQLQQTQKLESLGVLAGGIAHDFNNILMAIIGNADLALMKITKESPVVDYIHKIEQAALRAADLAKQMLAYSGKGKFVVENLDVNVLIKEMLHMLEVSISKKVVLQQNLTPQLPKVEADATQVRQVVMNLVINASEAIGDATGVITITTGYMECDARYMGAFACDEGLQEGTYVFLEVADTGCGMDKETQTKVFDPFFTTKFTGRGLGMAAVLGIVRGHKGAIRIYSEPGKGTTFKILLPASAILSELHDHVPCNIVWKESGTVLLVDDEATVRAIGTEMLHELGFTVLTAADGIEAVAVFKEKPNIDLVLLDLTMPRMDGELCFRELRYIRPDVKVIMSSGYNQQEVTRKFTGKGLAGFIQKPYRLSTLQEAISNVMCGQARRHEHGA